MRTQKQELVVDQNRSTSLKCTKVVVSKVTGLTIKPDPKDLAWQGLDCLDEIARLQARIFTQASKAGHRVAIPKCSPAGVEIWFHTLIEFEAIEQLLERFGFSTPSTKPAEAKPTRLRHC